MSPEHARGWMNRSVIFWVAWLFERISCNSRRKNRTLYVVNSPSPISLINSVYYRIPADLKVTKINRNNQYWILYLTYIKFLLIFVSVYSRIITLFKQLTGKIYPVCKGLLRSVSYYSWLTLSPWINPEYLILKYQTFLFKKLYF